MVRISMFLCILKATWHHEIKLLINSHIFAVSCYRMLEKVTMSHVRGGNKTTHIFDDQQECFSITNNGNLIEKLTTLRQDLLDQVNVRRGVWDGEGMIKHVPWICFLNIISWMWSPIVWTHICSVFVNQTINMQSYL